MPWSILQLMCAHEPTFFAVGIFYPCATRGAAFSQTTSPKFTQTSKGVLVYEYESDVYVRAAGLDFQYPPDLLRFTF